MITAILSAFFCEQWMHRRLTNLFHPLVTEIIVIAQESSKELEIARQYPHLPITLIPTKTVPPLYEAWNMAIEKASNSLLINSNSDDLYTPTGIETLFKAITSYDLLGGSYYLEHLSERKYVNACTYFRQKWVPAQFWIWRKSLGLFSTEYEIASDYEFLTRHLLNEKRIGATSKIVGIAYYNGMSRKKLGQVRRENRLINQIHYPKPEKK